MSQTSKPQVDIVKEVMAAITFCGDEGASLDDIQQYLKSTLKDNVPDLESIQSSLNAAVDKGLLLKLENGKYKIKRDDDDDDDENDEDENDDDEYEEIMTAIDSYGTKGASLGDIQKYLKSTLKDNVPNLECIQSLLNTAVDEELLELDNGKYKIKDYEDDEDDNDEDDDDDDESDDEDEDEEDNNDEGYGKDEENAQKVERSVDGVSQDVNQNVDSDRGNAGSSEAKKTNIPLPDKKDK